MCNQLSAIKDMVSYSLVFYCWVYIFETVYKIIDGKIYFLPSFLPSWLTDRPTDRPTDRLTDWLTGWLTDWLCVELVKYIQILVNALGTQYFSFLCQKSKLTWTTSYRSKTLMNIHHDAPNIHVPGINFLEFLVHALPISCISW